jgi:hypothetical protein
MKRIIVQFIDELNFVIVHQTDKGYEFDSGFYDSRGINEFWMYSKNRPEVCQSGLYVRGNSDKRDIDKLHAPNRDWKTKLIKAIEKYNKHFG